MNTKRLVFAIIVFLIMSAFSVEARVKISKKLNEK